MNPEKRKTFLPVISVFLILNALILIFKTVLENAGFDRDVLILANLFFFVLSVAGFLLQRKGLQSENPNAFVRGIYSAILLKLFICIIAVTIYAFVKTRNINRPAIFFSMGLYIIYTCIEVSTLMKMARRKSNVEKRITS